MTVRTALAALAAAAVAAAALVVIVHRRVAPPATAHVRLALSRQIISVVAYHAAVGGFFAAEGLDVDFVECESGKVALDRMLAGDADYATSADMPVMQRTLAGERLGVIATIAESPREVRVVARRDRGIARIEDLRGKRVGLTPDTSSDYYFDVLSRWHSLPPGAVTIVALPPSELVEALVDGSVDAVAGWDIHVLPLRRRLGDEAVGFDPEELYDFTWNVVARRERLDTRADEARRLVAGLAAASRDLRAEPDRIARFGAALHGEDVAGFIADGRYDFAVHLDQRLLRVLEEQARWSLAKRRSDAPMPDFLDVLDPRPLRAVDPRAVSLIHAR